MSAPRTYIIGLPVAVTVYDDGRPPHMSIDAAEVSKELWDDMSSDVSEDQLIADSEAVSAAFEARAFTTNTMQQDDPTITLP